MQKMDLQIRENKIRSRVEMGFIRDVSMLAEEFKIVQNPLILYIRKIPGTKTQVNLKVDIFFFDLKISFWLKIEEIWLKITHQVSKFLAE